MYSRLFVVLSSCLVVVGSGAQQTTSATPEQHPRLEEGTQIELRLLQPVSSKTANAGDAVQFQVKHDIAVSGLIVIAHGARAWGSIAEVQPSRRRGKPGKLSLKIESVELITGDTTPLRAVRGMVGTSPEIAAEAFQAAMGSYFILAPLTPFLFLQKGEEAIVPRGYIFTAYTHTRLDFDANTLRQAQERVPPPYSGPPVVYFFRRSDLGGKHAVYCGSVRIATVRAGQYARFQFPPGQYWFHSTHRREAVLELEANHEYFVDVSFHEGNFLAGHNELEPVTPEAGEDAIFQMDPAEAVDLPDFSQASLVELQAKPKR